MPVSRIAFALHDAVREVKELGGGDERPDFAVDIRMDQRTFDGVVKELEHHFGGARLRRDDRHRGLGQAVWYSGIRLVSVPPGYRG